MFTYVDLEGYFEERTSHYQSITSLKEVLELLYKLGVIGNSWKKGRKGARPNFSWGYREDSNEKLDIEKSMSVHFGLRNYFNM